MDLGSFQEQYPLLVTLILLAVICFFTWLAEHIVFRLVIRLGKRPEVPLPSSSIFANIARICIWGFGIAVALRVCFNVDLTAIIAAMGVGGIAISLGFQDTLSNLIGGLQVSMGKLVEPGQYIQVLSQEGLVEDVTWRHTNIVDADGQHHMIPNSLINKNSLVWLDPWVDVYVSFLVPLTTDLDVFSDRAIAAVAIALEEELAPDRTPYVQFTGTQEGGMSGNVKVTVMRNKISPRFTRDRVIRALDDPLKEAGYQA